MPLRSGKAISSARCWNLFVGVYQRVDSVEDGATRVGELADLIYRMRLRRHPKQDILIDVPETATANEGHWAEFRANAATFRTYDTRSDDQPAWIRATGMMEAASVVRTKVRLPIAGECLDQTRAIGQ